MKTDNVRETKYGGAITARFFVCSSGHVHIIGYGRDDQVPEYEIVLGNKLQQRCQEAIDTAQVAEPGMAAVEIR